MKVANQGQQGSRGAIIITWEQAPQNPQVPQMLERALRHFEDLQNDGEIQTYQVYNDLGGARGYAILEGQVQRLNRLVEQTGHREFLLTAQNSLPGFRATTAVGGSNGDVEEVLQVIERVQRDQTQGRDTVQYQMDERESERQRPSRRQREFSQA